MASSHKRVRFALLGLGAIARETVIPAFRHSRHAELVGLISRSRSKLASWGDKYRIPLRYPLERYEDALQGGAIDAVFIALPTELHEEYAERALNAYANVLCEAPLASTAEQARRMADAARRRHVRIATAYRLHPEPARIADSTHTHTNFHLRQASGRKRDALLSLGTYCVHAARHYFRSDPIQVYATQPHRTTIGILTFPGGGTASFSVSFGQVNSFDPTPGVKERAKEIDRFALSIREDTTLRPSIEDTIADLEVVDAMRESIRKARQITL